MGKHKTMNVLFDNGLNGKQNLKWTKALFEDDLTYKSTQFQSVGEELGTFQPQLVVTLG